jgi:hypothetical protein
MSDMNPKNVISEQSVYAPPHRVMTMGCNNLPYIIGQKWFLTGSYGCYGQNEHQCELCKHEYPLNWYLLETYYSRNQALTLPPLNWPQ